MCTCMLLDQGILATIVLHCDTTMHASIKLTYYSGMTIDPIALIVKYAQHSAYEMASMIP